MKLKINAGMMMVFKKYRGFTLIEAVIVIIITTIIAAFAVSKMQNMTGYRVVASGEQLLQDLRLTQSLAMTTDQIYYLSISGSSYSIMGTSAQMLSFGNTTVTLSSGLSFTTVTNPIIAFDSLGRPYTNATATTPLTANSTIQIQGGGVTSTITIIPETGRVILS